MAMLVLAGLLFVDDTDLIVVAQDPSVPVEQVVEDMQRATAAWWGGLWATGGALKPEKCSWGLVAFGWRNGQWYYRSTAEAPAQLIVNDPTGEPMAIQRL